MCVSWRSILSITISLLIWASATEAQTDEPATNPPFVTDHLSGDGFLADFYYTEGAPPRQAVMFLGGSEGGIPKGSSLALARRGFPVMALAYFGVKGLPSELARIPLEYFDRPIKWLATNPHARSGGIVVIGGSRGAELALLLASRHGEIKGVIARAPSNVVWPRVGRLSGPGWTIDGKEIPYMIYPDKSRLPDEYPRFIGALKIKSNLEHCVIPVELIQGPILLLSGSADSVWPSDLMGEMIIDRLRQKAFKYAYEHIKYPEAGHTMSEGLMLGGTAEGNRAASNDSFRRILSFLKAGDPHP